MIILQTINLIFGTGSLTLNNINGNIHKISITIDNVYNKLKNIDINLLIKIYKDRNSLESYLLNTHYNSKKIIKSCVYTQIQSKLL